jgi:hypothetical protein
LPCSSSTRGGFGRPSGHAGGRMAESPCGMTNRWSYGATERCGSARR